MERDQEPVQLLDLLKSPSPAGRNHEHSPHRPLDVTSAQASSYLSRIQEAALEDVLKEPSTIAAESSKVESELTNLCYREYPLFISVHQCSTAVRNAFDDFDESLSRLLESVPQLEDECRSFADKTQQIQSGRARAGLLLDHQEKINELLQLPRLMETCVRNGHYQDAIDLADHVSMLAGQERAPQLVFDVVAEVAAVKHLMLVQLVSLLREGIKLPTLIKTVTFLRRINTMDDSELEVVFLASRRHNFRARINELDRDKSDLVRYLRRYIDLCREHVYDIITQFAAIFEDTSQAVSFATESMIELTDLVLAHLPQMQSDAASMSSLLVQLGYCAQSFSRLGLDFSFCLHQPFAQCVLETYRQRIDASLRELSTEFEGFSKTEASPADHLVIADLQASALSFITSWEEDSLSLPPYISDMPPLAFLVNSHLTALNSLRLLAPQHLAEHIQSIQASNLIDVTYTIIDYLEQATTVPEPSTPTKPSHRRSVSSPRARLLRRNTETQLSPEVREVKRKHALTLCVLFAQTWLTTVRYLRHAMAEVYHLQKQHPHPDLGESITKLKSWIDSARGSLGLQGSAIDKVKPDAERLEPSGQDSNSTLSTSDDPTNPDESAILTSPIVGNELRLQDTLAEPVSYTDSQGKNDESDQLHAGGGQHDLEPSQLIQPNPPTLSDEVTSMHAPLLAASPSPVPSSSIRNLRPDSEQDLQSTPSVATHPGTRRKAVHSPSPDEEKDLSAKGVPEASRYTDLNTTATDQNTDQLSSSAATPSLDAHAMTARVSGTVPDDTLEAGDDMEQRELDRARVIKPGVVAQTMSEAVEHKDQGDSSEEIGERLSADEQHVRSTDATPSATPTDDVTPSKVLAQEQGGTGGSRKKKKKKKNKGGS